MYVIGEFVVVDEWLWWLFYQSGGHRQPLWAHPCILELTIDLRSSYCLAI